MPPKTLPKQAHKSTIKPAFKASEISLETLTDLRSQYEAHIPEKLTDLEKYRMTELPATIQHRISNKSQDTDIHLTKDELARLVEWKLKHGTFRPKLLALVNSNLETEILRATSSAYAAHLAKPDAYTNANAVTSLKGVGIATGSLVLSALDPAGVPFFGDEVFRWLMWDEPVTGSATGKGWDRKIGYVAKEYRRFVEVAAEVRKRLGVGALEVEMVGYVLGRTKADVNGEESGEKEGDDLVQTELVKAESSKRKADVMDESQDVKKPKNGKGKEEARVSEATVRSTRSTRASTKRRRHSE